LALFLLGAALSYAQVVIPTVPPPGSTAEDLAQLIGWIRFIGYFVAIAFILGSLYAMSKHHSEMGIVGLILAGALIIGAANAPAIAALLYKPNA
jgi:hypothetical protein